MVVVGGLSKVTVASILVVSTDFYFSEFRLVRVDKMCFVISSHLRYAACKGKFACRAYKGNWIYVIAEWFLINRVKHRNVRLGETILGN